MKMIRIDSRPAWVQPDKRETGCTAGASQAACGLPLASGSVLREPHDVENVLSLNQIDGKTQILKLLTGLFADSAPVLLIFNAMHLDKRETSLPIMGLRYEVKIQIGVCGP
jgi:hypothetical protein